MIYNIFSSLTQVLGRFFHGSGSGSGFFQIGSGFLVDPDLNSEKKSGPDPEKKPDPKHWFKGTVSQKKSFQPWKQAEGDAAEVQYVSVGGKMNTRTLAQQEFCFTSVGDIFKYS